MAEQRGSCQGPYQPGAMGLAEKMTRAVSKAGCAHGPYKGERVSDNSVQEGETPRDQVDEQWLQEGGLWGFVFLLECPDGASWWARGLLF